MRLCVNGQWHTVRQYDPQAPLADFLRSESVRSLGVKIGCAAGSCGACTVALTHACGGDAVPIATCVFPLAAALGAHVILPQIEAFNKAAHGEMEIELYYADQLVPTDELFRAMQAGTIDAVQSDDATMGSPVDISQFGGILFFSSLGSCFTVMACRSTTQKIHLLSLLLFKSTKFFMAPK